MLDEDMKDAVSDLTAALNFQQSMTHFAYQKQHNTCIYNLWSLTSGYIGVNKTYHPFNTISDY